VQEQKYLDPTEPEYLLVGFGKHDLGTVLSWIGTDREDEVLLAPKLWPPRYRPMRNCEENDLKHFKQYTYYVCDLLEGMKR
jgi:hypothetical protein